MKALKFLKYLSYQETVKIILMMETSAMKMSTHTQLNGLPKKVTT